MIFILMGGWLSLSGEAADAGAHVHEGSRVARVEAVETGTPGVTAANPVRAPPRWLLTVAWCCNPMHGNTAFGAATANRPAAMPCLIDNPGFDIQCFSSGPRIPTMCPVYT